SEEKVVAPFTYNLTEMVGRRSNKDRTMIVATVEVQKRHFWIAVIAVLPALIISLVAGTIIGVYAIIIFFAVEAVAFWLFASSTREGLQVQQWQALNDRRNAGTGKVFLCQREVDPLAVDIFQVKAGSVPVHRIED